MLCLLRLPALFSAVYLTLGAAAFVVLDNTNYTDVTIAHGSIRTNFVPARYCEPLTYNANNDTVKLPPKEVWQALINKYDPTPAENTGFLALDCEKLYFNGDEASIELHLSYLKQLQSWAREIRPNRVLGWYGVSNYANLSPNKTASRQALAELIDFEGPYRTAYFPTSYILANGQTPYIPNTTWEEAQHLDFVNIQETEKLSTTGTHLKIPYIWPQYYNDRTSLISAQNWTHILTTLQSTGYSGAILWGGQNPAELYNSQNGGYGPWVPATQDFLDLVNANSPPAY